MGRVPEGGMGSGFEELLPFPSCCAEALAPRRTRLFPEELAQVEHAVAERREEYETVRACAGEALGRLGLERPALVTAGGIPPVWPSGVVGSLTHTTGYRAAVVARERDARALGIDAERADRDARRIAAWLMSDAELAALGELRAEAPGVSWDVVAASARESLYKSWFSLEGAPLLTTECAVDLALESSSDGGARGHLGIRILRDADADVAYRGSWSQSDGLVRTAVWAGR